ncbi:MAG: IclR family transcriptional regulator [Stellaceae bacterium]
MAGAEGAGTVVRATRLLQTLAELPDGGSLKEIARRTALPPSTAHRLLQLLMQQGFVERDVDGQNYQTGPELFRVASLIASQSSLVDLARPFLRRVAQEFDEICTFGIYIPETRRATTIDHIQSTNPLQYGLQQFQSTSLLWGAMGRSILAYLPETEIAACLAEEGLAPGTGAPPPPPSVLRRELRQIRDRGYTCSEGQRIKGAVGVAAPVFRTDGRIFGSLCVTLPKLRYTRHMAERLPPLVVEQARALSTVLGNRRSAAAE